MKHVIIISLFTLCVTLFYNYVGQLVPQKEVHPPKSAEIKADMSAEEMVEAGRIIVEGKGTCLTCHNGSARFPVLDTVGSNAASRREGYDALEYLAEALYEPNAFIVEPFAPGMPPVHKPPIGLNHQEILTVIAWLQSKGGEVTVTMSTKLKYHDESAAPEAAPAAAGEAAPAATDGKGLVAQYGCLACHSVDSPTRLVGPPLNDIGARQSKAELYESLIEPDAKVVEGFPPGVMTATLNGTGFFDKVTPKELKLIVEYLASLKG